jgi:hypothetical protein
MSQLEKLIQRIKTLDKNMRFDQLQKVMESLGYTMKGPANGSSHFTFRKPGHNPITIPKHTPIKRAYVELIREVLESEEKDENKEKS